MDNPVMNYSVACDTLTFFWFIVASKNIYVESV